MIKIARPEAPAFLLEKENNVWRTETDAAIAHYQSGADAAFKFERYRDARLKAELEKVFVKCAYCDSIYSHTSDGDIEHFRPKGRVEGKNPESPGYYWLANDWDNLMLACQHCNQRRKHEKAGEVAKKTKSWGKLDQFPLSNEAARLTSHKATRKAIEKEENARQLLNPCKDKPEEHFAYDPSTAAMIYLTKMAEVSADVYVLWRPKLVRERKERCIEVFARMDIVKKALEDFNDSPGQKNRAFLKTQIERLMALASPQQPFAGLARYFIRIFLKENALR